MKDLFRCLDEYPDQLLRAISQVWQVSLPEGDSREKALHLAEAMCAPDALERTLQELTPPARCVLAEIVKEGGVAPGHRLLVKYGGIRRLGPAAMAREEPWSQPKGVLEELYYKGIIYRAYATVADHYGEVYFIPQQLLTPLQGLESQQEELDVQQVPTPVRIKQDGGALAEDLLAFLVRIRQDRISASGRNRPLERPLTLDQIDLGPRLLGSNNPERLALIRRLLWRLGLLQNQKDMLRPSPRARTWLRLPDLRRAQSVYLAWRGDPHWDELRQLASLQLEDPGWQTSPVVARSALLGMLAKCPADHWLSLASFVEALKRHHPDFLRLNGDYDSSYVLDARTGQYLSGFASWDKIEGVLATHVITSSLHWLGIVDLGYGPEDDRPTAFRMTDQGQSLLTSELEMPKTKEPASSTLAKVGDDLTIAIPVANSMYERYQLERFAEWQVQDTVATYRLTADSVWKGYNAGVKTVQIVNFLKRITRNQGSPTVLRTVQAWGGRFGRATLRQTLLLRTADGPTMQQIRAQPKIRQLLGQVVSPTTCLVDKENASNLIKQLKDLGIWPLLSE